MKLQHKTTLMLFLSATILFFGTETASAVTRTWDGGGATGNWSEAANWSGDAIPTSADEAVFNATSVKNATIDANFTVSTVQINSGYTGTVTQGAGANLITNSAFTQAAGSFQGSSGTITINSGNLTITGGAFAGGTGLITGGFGAGINQSGGTFSSAGDADLTYFTLSGGTFNAPNGIFTISADYRHTAGGTFNAGTGTVKFTGYQTFNCINQIIIDVATTETFNNLTLANSFCNTRYVSAGDTLIVNGSFHISYGNIGGSGRIRPLGTTTIDANNTRAGGPIVEYVTPNTNVVINNPSSTVYMFPIEMNAANSTLTSSGSGRVNFSGMTFINGTLNQPNAIWDFTAYPGYTQAGGTLNGSSAAMNISNGVDGTLLSGGTINGGTGKITGDYNQTGGVFSTQGDMDTSNFTLSGGTFNAPSGTMKFTGGNGNCYFTHTAASGTFTAGTGTVEVQQGICGFNVNVSENFNNLRFNGNTNVISANDTLVVNGTMTFNGGGGSNGGSIVANGNVFYTNGGGIGNTIVKFVDSATRTLNLNASSADYSTLTTLVNNPNITINAGTTPTAWVSFNAITLQQGIVNQGTGRAFISNIYNQSGGTYNGGNYINGNTPARTITGDFTLSGGDFNADAISTFGGKYTHTSGGNFNYGTGTVIFGGPGGLIDINTVENFNHVRFEQSAASIATGDTIVANGNVAFTFGYVNGGTVEVKGNVSVAANASGGSAALKFTGTGSQTFTNTGGITVNGTWTVNKPNSLAAVENGFAPAAPTNLFISGNIGNNASATLVPLDIVSGNVLQTGSFNHSLAFLNVASGTSLVNDFGGSYTLGGNVANNGNVRLNADGIGCQNNNILIRSTNATQRSWTGSGFFQMIDVDVSGQSGTPIITVYSGTNSGNNGANWLFDSNCFVPTASTVTLSGRVTRSNGRGIKGVRLVLTDSNGNPRIAITNPFGYYRFAEISAGETVVISANSKQYTFPNPTQILTAGEDLDQINFIADEK